jgi:hypothetical protein
MCLAGRPGALCGLRQNAAVDGTRWCPECGDEFRPGVTACPDCEVRLVSDPPRPAEQPAASSRDHEQLEYDFADWPALWRDALKLLIRGSDIAHFWDSPTMLVVPRQRQAEVDGFIEYVESGDTPSSSDKDEDADVRPVAIQRYERDRSTPWATFRSDLRASARAWMAAPGLPLTTGCLLLVEHALGAASPSAWTTLPLIALTIAAAAFSGTQRIWYLRAFHHDQLAASELGPLTMAFLGRFFRLGVAATLASLPLTIALGIAAGPTGFAIASVTWWLIMDFALTFVTPALAYTTHSLRSSFCIGRRMILQTWPTSTWYILTPGLAAAALVWARPRALIGTWLAAGIGIASGMLALWFKGAIAAYYLRRHPETRYDGAAYDDTEDTSWRWTTEK